MQAGAITAQGMQPPPGKLEGAYIFLALLLVTQALEPLLLIGSSGSDDALSDSNPASLLSALAIYVVALVILARRPAQALDTIKNNPLLIAIFALPLISVAWSVDPGTTFRRAAALVMTAAKKRRNGASSASTERSASRNATAAATDPIGTSHRTTPARLRRSTMRVRRLHKAPSQSACPAYAPCYGFDQTYSFHHRPYREMGDTPMRLVGNALMA